MTNGGLSRAPLLAREWLVPHKSCECFETERSDFFLRRAVEFCRAHQLADGLQYLVSILCVLSYRGRKLQSGLLVY